MKRFNLIFGLILAAAAPLAFAQSNASLVHDGPLGGIGEGGGVASCSADALLNQGFDIDNFNNARTSDVTSDLLVSENFISGGIGGTVDTGEADSMIVWGIQVEFEEGTGFIAGCDIDGADFEVTSWTDDGGAPGAVIDTQVVTPTVTDTGVAFAFTSVLQAELPLSPALDLDGAGWVSVQRQATAQTVGGNDCLFLWVDNLAGVGDNAAYQVDTATGDEVPADEPSDQAICVEGTGEVVGPEIDPADVAGFTFSGDVTGISGSAAWASDMRLDVVGPAASTAVGGFDNPGPLSWDFDGAGSTDDGSYASDHSNAFAPGTTANGDWTLTFTNDWGTSSATQCWTNTFVTFIRNDGTETEVVVPDQCYAAGEDQTIIVPLGPQLPETQAVPVNNFWALALMTLLLAGLGTVVIRRMG